MADPSPCPSISSSSNTIIDPNMSCWGAPLAGSCPAVTNSWLLSPWTWLSLPVSWITAFGCRRAPLRPAMNGRSSSLTIHSLSYSSYTLIFRLLSFIIILDSYKLISNIVLFRVCRRVCRKVPELSGEDRVGILNATLTLFHPNFSH